MIEAISTGRNEVSTGSQSQDEALQLSSVGVVEACLGPPRTGAFEVFLVWEAGGLSNKVLMYSKLSSGKLPNVKSLVERLRDVLMRRHAMRDYTGAYFEMGETGAAQ